MKQRKGWRISCDVGKAAEGLENELWCRWSDGKVGEWAAHSPILLPHYQCYGSFSNPSDTSSNVTAHSPTILSLLLHHRFFTYVTWRASHVLKRFLPRCSPGILVVSKALYLNLIFSFLNSVSVLLISTF